MYLLCSYEFIRKLRDYFTFRGVYNIPFFQTDQDYNATTPHIPIVKEITCGVYKRIRYLTDRFSISTLHLSSVGESTVKINHDVVQITIDRHLILHFSNVFKFNTFCKIIADVDFEEETDSIIFQK